MKAWLLDQLGGGIDSLRVDEIPDPNPAANQVVIDVEFAALNPADRYLAENQYPARPKLPHVLGRDGAGKISALGPDVTNHNIADRVAILRGDAGVNQPGTFAAKVCVDADNLVPIPAGWSIEQAAAAPLVYCTAEQAINQWEPMSNAVVLITGASGGVGIASVQLAKAMGHFVIALSRSESKWTALRNIGADLTLDPTDASWPKQLKALLGKRRVDLAIDNVGGEEFNRLLEVMANRGKISVVGRLAGEVPRFNTAAMFSRRLQIGGVFVSTYSAAEMRQSWEIVVRTLNRAGAKPLIDSVHAFDNLKTAFARLQDGPLGKVLLRVKG